MQKQNEAFKRYTRRVAFNISLSYNQIDTLLRLDKLGPMGLVEKSGHVISALRKLRDIGLIEKKILNKKKWKDVMELVSWEVTEEGKIMVQMLKKAGYEIFSLEDKQDERVKVKSA